MLSTYDELLCHQTPTTFDHVVDSGDNWRICDRVFQQNNEPMPSLLATTRQWLLDNSFTPKHLSLTWGDARLGNTIFRDYDVAAALDWEMACIGDPESDLAWRAPATARAFLPGPMTKN
jgi:aminoglycoside phosphotransferase (APT) family kinase protein